MKLLFIGKTIFVKCSIQIRYNESLKLPILDILEGIQYTNSMSVSNLEASDTTTIVPIIKNKAGDLSNSNNYRPIALANVISKIFESLILLRFEQFLTTADKPFSFKSRQSTDFCIFTLKEYIEIYKLRNTSVFVTFLNASKTFDRVDHWLLFKKLIDKRIPLQILWGNTTTSSFFVSNGVKQGGILSPILFNVYMNQLSIKLNASNIGGNIGGGRGGGLVNHLFLIASYLNYGLLLWGTESHKVLTLQRKAIFV